MNATDFNDHAAIAGKQAVKAAIDAAAKTIGDEDDGPLAPPVMPKGGFPLLMRDVVNAACAHSEAHPVAVAANFLAMFCASIGRGPYQRIGDAVIHARPFPLIVGKSGKARKGTAEHTPREIAKRADEILRKRSGKTDRLKVHTGGLSSGEGVAWAIRDPKEADANGKGADQGVKDKRLLVIESEFANVLAQVKREGNILSATIRNLWDGRDIEPLTKTSQLTATKPHVVVMGHVTGYELKEKSTANDAANGLLNRFIVLHVHRPRLTPLPKPTPEETLNTLAERLADAITFATGGNPHASNTIEVRMTHETEDLWCDQYPSITKDSEGLAGSLLARSEVYARMLAMAFALMDKRSEIEPCDLLSALDWVEYWRQSITYIFLTSNPDTELDPFTQEVMELIHQRQGGISLTEIQNHWKRHRIVEVKTSLAKLLDTAPPLIEMRIDRTGCGRAAQRYYPPSL